jgi:phenylalanine-4-hydroxylase
MKQIYENYTAEDQQVWQLLFDRQIKNLQPVASTEYLKSIEHVEFKNTEIPNFDNTNMVLNKLTGWSLHVVPGIIPGKEFFELLSLKKFCATTWLRKMSQLDYLEEPDMFHDVFGHVPLLSNAAYCKFFEGISRIALKHIDDELAIELLGRIYWFTIEFGLIRENGKTKIYGAGILSSPGETAFCLSDKVERVDYDIDKIFDSSYRTDVYQTKYFMIDSFEQLYKSINEIELKLEAHLITKV